MEGPEVKIDIAQPSATADGAYWRYGVTITGQAIAETIDMAVYVDDTVPADRRDARARFYLTNVLHKIAAKAFEWGAEA
jgi:hypothetical protein